MPEYRSQLDNIMNEHHAEYDVLHNTEISILLVTSSKYNYAPNYKCKQLLSIYTDIIISNKGYYFYYHLTITRCYCFYLLATFSYDYFSVKLIGELNYNTQNFYYGRLHSKNKKICKITALFIVLYLSVFSKQLLF